MKAILIDAENQEVKDVKFDGSLKQMYELIDCRLVEFCLDLGNGNVLFVDEEGLLCNPTFFFKLKTEKPMQWLAGNGLIFKEESDTDVTVEDILEKIQFMKCDDPKSPVIPQPEIFVMSWEDF